MGIVPSGTRRAVPALVELRARVDELIREAVEPGAPLDCVTHEHVAALAAARGVGEGHHPEQLRCAVAESPAWAAMGASTPACDVVVASGDDAKRLTNGLTCFGCGPVDRVGYARLRALAGVRLRSGEACAFDLGCRCCKGWGGSLWNPPKGGKPPLEPP